jgi:5S rRNA maturation endonuclease (ribonuclease M5)
MKTMKKSRSYNQHKLKILSDKLCDRIESLLDYFEIEYKQQSKMITMSCPIHGGDNTSAINIYPQGESYRGNWKCRTHHCEETFKPSIIGFIRGILSHRNYGWEKSNDSICSFYEAVQFAEKFLKENLDSIKVDNKHIEKNTFINTINNITSKEKSNTTYVSRQTIIRSLDIPSKYFLDRGYSKDILIKYDVGDCKNSGKEMSDRAVVPIYDEEYKYMIGCTGRSIFDQCSNCKSYHENQIPCETINQEYKWLMSKWRHSKNFKTQECLYNFWFAKQYIQKSNSAIIVESPGNVWRLEESGIHNSVAIFGSSLSDKQKMLLDISGALNLILIMDNDEAGKKAAEQIIKKCERTYNVYSIKIDYDDVGSMSKEQIISTIVPQLEKLAS